jgi:excisionase family DNA binding protein
LIVPHITFDRLYVGMSANAASPTPSALLDVNQVAERLCVSPRFVRRLIDERRIPFYKLGKFVRFDPAEIDAWIDARRVQAAS